MRFGLEVARRFKGPTTRPDDAVWLAREMAARGPVYIKIGQFMSSRRDIFDPVLVDSLQSLQDRVPPMAFTDLQHIMEREGLGNNVISFDPEPIASASIGQVHVGSLADGVPVAIKVRRPKIREQIVEEVQAFTTVVRLLELVAWLLRDGEAAHSMAATRRLLQDFTDVMLTECDYVNEARNMMMYRAFSDRGHLRRGWVSPRVFPELCSDGRIVMEYLPSVRLDAIVPQLEQTDRAALANQVMDLYVSHMLLENVVHADFQPGNVGVDAKGRIVLYDFGNIICLPPSLVHSLREALFPLMNRDADALVQVLRTVGVLKIRDEEALKRYVQLAIKYVWCMDIKSFKLSALDVDSLRSNKLPVEIDGVVFRMLRGFILVEGLCKSIDADFTYSSTVEKYGMQLAKSDDRFYWAKAKADLKQLLASATQLVDDL